MEDSLVSTVVANQLTSIITVQHPQSSDLRVTEITKTDFDGAPPSFIFQHIAMFITPHKAAFLWHPGVRGSLSAKNSYR
jgi:hypothetical protein